MKFTRAVLFDLDDTLFDHSYAARCVLQVWRERYAILRQYPLEFLEREDLRLLNERHARVMNGSLSLDDARIERVQSLFACCGDEITFERARELAAHRVEIYRQSRRAVPGAIELLAALKRTARIGVVTNNFTGEQLGKMEACGLTSLVDVLVTSEETGLTKPSPDIFHLAVERLGCRHGDSVMVGDSWEVDVIGALHAGLRAVWFNRHGDPKPDNLDVAEIRSLEPAGAVASQISPGS